MIGSLALKKTIRREQRVSGEAGRRISLKRNDDHSLPESNSIPERRVSPENSHDDLDKYLDGALVAAVGETLRMQRNDAASHLAAKLSRQGVDPTVCAFLEDDLKEAADALADAEMCFQEMLDALGAGELSPGVLMERAADAVVLERLDYLHSVLSGMRRRVVQVAVGIRTARRRSLSSVRRHLRLQAD